MRKLKIDFDEVYKFLDLGDLEEYPSGYSFSTSTTDDIIIKGNKLKSHKELYNYLNNSDDYCSMFILYNKRKECILHFDWKNLPHKEVKLVGEGSKVIKGVIKDMIKEYHNNN